MMHGLVILYQHIIHNIYHTNGDNENYMNKMNTDSNEVEKFTCKHVIHQLYSELI